MNIFLRELKANFKSLLIWTVINLLFITIAAAKFSGFANDPAMLAILEQLPEPLLVLFNIRIFNLTTLSGFYGLMFVYFALMGAIAAAMWGSDIISKEERDKTVEFSLVLPVTRSKVITAKALAALLYCILFMLIIWGISLVAVQPYNPDSAFHSFLALEMQALLVIELIFLAIGLLLGCAMKYYKRTGSTAVALILTAYVLYVLSSIVDKLDNLKYLTPFRYFDAADLLQKGRLDTGYLVLSAVIILVCLVAGYWSYNRRDLYI